MIPVKIILDGDTVKGRELIGFGKLQMSILEKSMSFQKLNEGTRTVEPYPGVIVECYSSFSTQKISISVPKGGKQEPAINREKDQVFLENIPLVATGLAKRKTEALELSKSLCYYGKPFTKQENIIFCTGLTEHYTPATLSFHQVKYEKEPVSYMSGEAERIKNVVFTLSIALAGDSCVIAVTVTDDGPGSSVTAKSRDELRRSTPPHLLDKGEEGVAQKLVAYPGLTKIYRSQKTITQSGGFKTYFSTNFNSDKTKLFVVFGYMPNETIVDPYYDSSANSYINGYIYSRRITEGFGNVVWDLESSFTHHVSYHMGHGYVDKTGTIWGAYKPLDVGGKTTFYYATVNIFTGAVSSASKYSIGYSIHDGDFTGIYSTIADTGPKYALNLRRTYMNVFTLYNQAYSYETLYDKIGWTGSTTTYASEEVVGDSSAPILWREYDGRLFADSSMTKTVSCGDEYFEFTDGEQTHHYGYYEKGGSSSFTWQPFVGPFGVITYYQSWEYNIPRHKVDEYREVSDLIESINTKGGAIGLTSTSSPTAKAARAWDVTWTASFSSSEGRINDQISSWSSTDPSKPYGTFMEPPMQYDTFPTPGAATVDNSIKFPFVVENATPTGAFMAVDNNKNGIFIKGLRYTDVATSAKKLKVTINDVDVKERLLSLTGIEEKNFQYLGFIF